MANYEKVHKPISVWLYYENGKSLIRAFAWKNRLYKVSANNLLTKAYKGSTPVYLFAVSNDTGAYKLRLDTDTLHWWLEEIYWEE